MNTKRFLITVAAALLIACLLAGNAIAQNFRVDIGGVIRHGAVTTLEGADSATNDEVTFFLDDSPGAASPDDPESTRIIPGGDGAEDVYPTFGGVLAYANDQGSFRAHLAGGTGVASGEAVENEVVLGWQRDFVKVDEATPFHFIVNPGVLRIVDGRGTPVVSNDELEASWRLTAKVEGITQFEAFKRLHGKGSFTSQIQAVRNNEFRNFYRMTDDTGPVSGELTLIGEELDVPDGKLYTYIGGQYKTPSFQGTLDLTGIGVGETFTVEYVLNAHTLSFGPDTLAESMSGDPLKYTGGVTIEYGDYGEILRITDYTIDDLGHSHVQYPSDPDYYYILCRGEDVQGIEAPLAMKVGEDGTDKLVDERPAHQQQRSFYLVKRVHHTAPLDSDGDDIDDIYELTRPSILDPLDPTDAVADTDEDGRNARQEYLEGTDPETPDGAPEEDGLYPAPTFAIGEGSDLETADLNNDGIVDLISFNAALYISLGNADGTFAPPMEVAIPDGGVIGDITFGHLNADEFPDVVFADELNDRVEILFGDGAGGFASNARHDLGASPRRAALALVNNDSFPDIITINENARSISVLIGGGDGTFGSPTTFETEFPPADATTALLNDDEHPDLVVAMGSGGGSNAAVFLNNGDGTFADKVTYPAGFFPQRVAVGDVNGDGTPDIITSNQTGDGVSVLIGNGDGTLQEKVDYPTGDNPRGLLLTDLDGDSDLDLLVAHVSANFHAILLNDGSGTFDDAARIPSASNNLNCLLVDMNRDGVPDIVSRAGGQAMVLHGLPGGGFDTREQISFGLGFTPRDFEVADVNGDGRPDLVVSNGGNHNTVEVLLGQEGGGFDVLPPLLISENVEGLAVARLDDDAHLDLAVLTQRPDFFPGNASNQLHVLTGDGAGGFAAEAVMDLDAQPKELFAGDFNGDGLNDLLAAFNTTGDVQLFVNTDSGFVAQTPVDLGDAFGGAFGTRIAGDFNGDGIVDLAAAIHVGGPALIKILQGTDGGGLSESQVITPLNGGSAQKLALADIIGDSRPDLLAIVNVAGALTLVVYPGNADGTFGAEEPLIDPYSGDIAAADANDDGRPDLLNGSTIHLAEPGGTYAPPQTYYIGASSLPVQVVDMNGDNQPDLIAADDLGDAISILYHK